MTAHVRKAWESYREMAVSPNAGVTQVSETQMAFYAGAACLFYLLTRPGERGGILSAGPDADAESEAAMMGLEAELQGFALEQLRKARSTT